MASKNVEIWKVVIKHKSYGGEKWIFNLRATSAASAEIRGVKLAEKWISDNDGGMGKRGLYCSAAEFLFALDD